MIIEKDGVPCCLTVFIVQLSSKEMLHIVMIQQVIMQHRCIHYFVDGIFGLLESGLI